MRTGEHPIAFGSRCTQRPGTTISQHRQRELLAPVEGARHFRSILYGRHFVLRTDNAAVQYIMNGKPYNRRTMKWLQDMEEFSFDIEKVPATKLKHADALSRIKWPGYHPEMAKDPKEIPHVNYIQHANHDWVPIQDFRGWADSQKEDAGLRARYHQARRPDETQFAIKDGVLYQLVEKNYVPLVPKSLQHSLLCMFHGPPAQGHQGAERQYMDMKQHVYWSGMKRDVEDFVKKCDACQRHKRSYLKPPMQHQVIPSQPFEVCTMDLVARFQEVPLESEYILVIQDTLTRWVELAPVKIADADTVMNKFMTYWVSRYGPPQRLLTDRGAQFVSSIMDEFCRLFGIEKVHTIAYRPQGNGANERMHQELSKYFAMYLDHQSKGSGDGYSRMPLGPITPPTIWPSE